MPCVGQLLENQRRHLGGQRRLLVQGVVHLAHRIPDLVVAGVVCKWSMHHIRGYHVERYEVEVADALEGHLKVLVGSMSEVGEPTEVALEVVLQGEACAHGVASLVAGEPDPWP